MKTTLLAAFSCILLALNSFAQPSIVTEPPADLVVAQGSSASLSVVASGAAPLSYQWFHNGTPVAGATQDTYSISNAQFTASGFYNVLVANPSGSVGSSNSVVTVTSALVYDGLTNQPVGQASLVLDVQ